MSTLTEAVKDEFARRLPTDYETAAMKTLNRNARSELKALAPDLLLTPEAALRAKQALMPDTVLVEITTPRYSFDVDDEKARETYLTSMLQGLVRDLMIEVRKKGDRELAEPQVYLKRVACAVEMFVWTYVIRESPEVLG